MTDLSDVYAEARALRSSGSSAQAVATLQTSPPASDRDALEAVVCLFSAGDMTAALHVCRAHRWRETWGSDIANALLEGCAGGKSSRALSLAARAAASPKAPADVAAFYLMLLQQNGAIEEAYHYMTTRLQKTPSGEIFLLTVMAEIAASMRNWREAYRLACGVMSCNPDDHRALLMLGVVSYELGNVHESLGHALRASVLRKGSVPAVLQVMRCRNELGNAYGAIAASDTLPPSARGVPDVRVELGRAYASLGQHERAIAEYRAALDADASSAIALRALVAAYAAAGDRAALQAAVARYPQQIDEDFETLYALGLEALAGRDISAAGAWFEKSRVLAQTNGDLTEALGWPVTEPRLRHDLEQLELLERRGKLPDRGRAALGVLRRYRLKDARADAVFAPAGAEQKELKAALCTTFHLPQASVAGSPLGQNDYAAIEDRYLETRCVVIDDFLSTEALHALREFCEEATIWKFHYGRGYVGARLAQGFSPELLLAISDELKRRMQRVIGTHPLTQAWAFKYDQRLQGINLHADFAEVNVNFWLTSDEACQDPQTGGLVVYDLPVPRSWTFADYNSDPERLAVYLRENGASPRRIPYRANRCVLFDSSLIHTTDEMRFRPGYENRRVNVTLLYGTPRNTE